MEKCTPFTQQCHSLNLVLDNSIQRVLQDESLKNLLIPITIDQISNRNISSEFKALGTITQSKSHIMSLEQNNEFSSLNRYSDVLPYSQNIVKISSESLNSRNYINANYIKSPFQEAHKSDFVATQGPLKHTMSHFWNMVEFVQAQIIIAIIETDSLGTRCHKYWPGQHNRDTENFSIMLESFTNNSFVQSKQLVVQRKLGNQNRAVSHFHIFDWKDHQALDNTFFVHYVDFLEMLWNYKSSPNAKPIVVHCSAGIGRTGTLIASYYLYEQFKKAKSESKEFKFSIFGLVRHLKEQRFGAVQTGLQYKFLYEIVKHFK